MPKKKMGMPFYRYEERIPTDDFEEIIYEKDGPIGRLILNTPEKRNPLSYRRINELSMGLQEMEMDDDIRVIIIKGAGPAFCSGYDLTPGSARDNNPNPDDPRAGELRDQLDARLLEYVNGYRGVLGFCYLVLTR